MLISSTKNRNRLHSDYSSVINLKVSKWLKNSDTFNISLNTLKEKYR